MNHELTRREFCAKSAAALGLAAAAGLGGCVRPADLAEPSPLVVASSPDMIRSGVIEVEQVRAVLDAALKTLTGADSMGAAWDAILPGLEVGDSIGIKVNSLSPELPSHPQVAQAAAQSLMSHGVDPGRIIIWDRANQELRRAGYRLNTGFDSVRVFGTDEVGYDDTAPFHIRERRVTFSGIVTRLCRYHISLPVLKSHDRAGITFSMKNWYGAIPLYDGMPFSSDFVLFMHADKCARRIAQLNGLPPIRDKLRLVVGDALYGSFAGGPAAPAQWTGNRLIVSRDPVAADAEALALIDGLRRENGLEPVAPEAGFLAHAEAAGLGLMAPPPELIRRIVI